MSDGGRMPRFAFAGRTVVLTGAAAGIGAALALELARRRSVLALIDRDADGLARVAGTARELGAPEVSTFEIDLADGGDRRDLATAVATRHGGADLLINNAGVTLFGSFEENRPADIEWLLEVNLLSTIRMTKAFLPQLLSRPGAHLLNMSSAFGLMAVPGQVAYVTSKFAIRGFTEALRAEIEDRGVGVTVVHPGGIRTDIARNARSTAPDHQATAEKMTNALLRLPPEEAARQIITAIATRRRRLLIAPESRAMDWLTRLAPARYWSIACRLPGVGGR